jgi:hypothetical protein
MMDKILGLMRGSINIGTRIMISGSKKNRGCQRKQECSKLIWDSPTSGQALPAEISNNRLATERLDSLSTNDILQRPRSRRAREWCNAASFTYQRAAALSRVAGVAFCPCPVNSLKVTPSSH